MYVVINGILMGKATCGRLAVRGRAGEDADTVG